MNISVFEKTTPVIDSSAYLADNATVIGDIQLGANSSVWPQVVIRGDVNSITIGDDTNIQDGTVIHVTHASDVNGCGYATTLGDGITVGHLALLHGCTIEDHCLIGMRSTVMDGAVIQSGAMLAAGSLVPPGKIIEGGYLWLGNPAKKIRPLTDDEQAFIRYSAQHYCRLAERYRKQP